MNESEISYSLILELQYQKLVAEGKLQQAQAELEEAAARVAELEARVAELEAAPPEARPSNGVAQRTPVTETP